MIQEGSLLRQAVRRRVQKARTRLIGGATGQACGHPLPLNEFSTPPAPFDADWSWRPELWCAPLGQPDHEHVTDRYTLCHGIKVFHNGIGTDRSEIGLRHQAQSEGGQEAPYGLEIATREFSGEFLSLALDLPLAATTGLLRRHLIRVTMSAQSDAPVGGHIRLNVVNGPNTEQVSEFFETGAQDVSVELDLMYSKLNESRVERGWVDIIFNNPGSSRINLRDLKLCRLPRAEF